MIGKPLTVSLTALLSVAPAVSVSARLQDSAASTDPYLQTVWTTEDGLPQNSVTGIIQTRDGYLWLSTFGGLARFDGVRFTIFNSANTSGLKNNRITALWEDQRGTLWLGTETGDLMSFNDGVGTTYPIGGELRGAVVWGLKGDRRGAIWLATSKGLARFQDGKFTLYTTRDGLPDTLLFGIEVDQADSIWLTAPGRLIHFDGRRFITHALSDGMIQGYFIPSRQGGFWLSTTAGVARYFDGKFRFYPHSSRASWYMRTLLEDREGTLWIAYYTPVMVHRFQTGRFSPYALSSGSHLVRSMYEDREGNLWMGSDGGGLVRLKKRHVTTYTTDDGLPSNTVRAITDDGAGGVWISTGNGLAHIRGGKTTVYTGKDGLATTATEALLRDRAGNLWIGGHPGLTRYKDGRFVTYNYDKALPGVLGLVSSLAEDRDGNVWIGTLEGLGRFRDGAFTTYTRDAGLVSNDVRSIVETRDGALWVGTTGGLSRLKNGVFTNYTVRDGLSNDYVRAIVEEPDGALWLGTYGGGLNRFKDGRFTPVTTKDGLFDDFVSRILEDDDGNFWMLGNRGIFKVTRAALNDFAEGRERSISSIAYGIADGMKSSEGNGGAQPAGWRAADGKLWFPTIKGVAVLDPTPVNTVNSPVVIQEVTVDGAALAPSRGARLEPAQRNLEIHYAGLSFSRPEQVKFKYKLAGFDPDWVNAGTRRTAYYPQLPPGSYTFTVMADNGYGVWNTEGQSLSVIVLPPFYRTWWFTTIAFITLSSAIAVTWRRRVSQLQRAHAAQQAFSRQLIASQEAERKRIAAELHDGLGQRLVIIKNLALILNGSATDGSREQIDEISGEASQALEEVREISYNLRPHQLDRVGLTKAVETLVKKARAASPIAFTSEIDNIDGVFPKEAEINFYRVAQESVSNVVKHSGASDASLTVQRMDGRILLTVRDNGKGFVPEATHAASQPGGFGLVGISERATLLGGHATIHSVPGRGTTVGIAIDLRQVPHGR